MNVLPDVAVWKSNKESPSESGVYFTFSERGGLHQWGYSKEHDVWGDGLYTPGANFKWLNVRIDMLSGTELPC